MDQLQTGAIGTTHQTKSITKSITWKEKINQWSNGNYQHYAKSEQFKYSNTNRRFFYETSCCNRELNNIYEEKYIESNDLEIYREQNYESFIKYINSSNNQSKDATVFYNLSKDTLLIIPIPRKNKLYVTIKDFMDNASIDQQTGFWKIVAEQIKSIFLETNINNLYISTHGLGVPYFHLRLCIKPKYYHTQKFIDC